MSVQSNWWEHFFEGLSVKLWLQVLSPEHTASEAITIAGLLRADPGAELLDVPCGGGRLSLALARARLLPYGSGPVARVPRTRAIL
jgi:2-polyprenyl-3-methyl-5-hydroxy-6-metoxy-1,4-benzoquinol methylase